MAERGETTFMLHHGTRINADYRGFEMGQIGVHPRPISAVLRRRYVTVFMN
jgi:hypothetical protein